MNNYSLEIVTRSNASRARAREFARVKTDCFRNDTVYAVFNSVDESLADNCIPPIYEYERLRRKLDQFQRLYNRSTTWSYFTMLESNRYRVYLLRDRAGECVGVASIFTPVYAPIAPSRSLFQWIRYLYWKAAFKLLDILQPWPMYKRLHQEMVWASQNTRVADTPESLEALKSRDPKDLLMEPYPRSYSYWISEFGVRSDQHGKGVGRLLMESVLEDLRRIAVTPADIGPAAPAKVALQATPAARKFYEHMGFECGMAAEHIVNGTLIVQSSYFLNL